MRNLIRTAVAVAAVSLFSAGAAMAEYPDHPITLIIPQAPGGATDIQARMLMTYVQKYIGQPIVVENYAAGAYVVGMTRIAHAKPDGYTFGHTVFPSAFGPILTGDATYKLDDFEPLMNQWVGRSCICVRADSPDKTLADFVAKAKQGTVNVSVATLNSAAALSTMQFEQAAGFKLNYVPFGAGNDAYTAMLGGHVDYTAQPIATVVEDYKAHKIRALAIVSDDRWDVMPDVPTFKEQGYDVTLNSLGGYIAPAGLPADVEAKLVDALTKAAHDPDYLKMMKDRDIQLKFMTQQEYKDFLPKGFAQLTDLYKQLDAKK